jgi:hypothetical protein
MSKSFTAQVEDIVSTSEKRLNALMRESLSRVIDDMQTPTAKGGRMHVDTGFLRASGQASLNGMPTGPGRGDREGAYVYSPENTINVSIGQLKLGSTFFFGWTANYAQYRELYDGFLETALQKWPAIVASVTDDIRKRIK